MSRFSCVLLQVLLVGINVIAVHCLTEAEETSFVEALEPLVMSCIKDCSLTADYFKEEKADHLNSCAKKCMLKKLGLLNENGKYDREFLKETIVSIFGNEEEAKEILAKLEKCFKGKDEELKNDKDDTKKTEIIFECLANFKGK